VSCLVCSFVEFSTEEKSLKISRINSFFCIVLLESDSYPFYYDAWLMVSIYDYAAELGGL